MLIECTIRRRHPKTGVIGTTVSFPQWPTRGGAFDDRPEAPAATYHFKPVDGNVDSPHIAEVPVEAHYMRLFECNGAYRPYHNGNAAEITQPLIPSAGVPVNSTAPVATSTAASPPPIVPTENATVAAASPLAPRAADIVGIETARFLETPVKDIRPKIATYPRDVLIEAHARLDAQQGPERRRALLAVLEAHLGIGATA